MTIKRTPEEFRVDEVLAGDVERALSRRPGKFALYRLTKRGLTTPDAVGRFAEALGCPADAIAVGGLKDKQALTRQHVTVRMDAVAVRAGDVPAGGASRGREMGPKARSHVEGEQWKAALRGYVGRAIDGLAIAGNVFEIVVSGLDPRACELMDGAAGLLEVGGRVAREIQPDRTTKQNSEKSRNGATTPNSAKKRA